MISGKDLKIDVSCLGDGFILTGIAPWHDYIDGKRQSNLKGYKYEVAVPALRFEKLAVKIEGRQLIEMGDEPQAVSFSGLEVTPYAMDSQLRLSATAKSIEKVNKATAK